MVEDNNIINEPGAAYGDPLKKKITFFNSFEEAEEHGLREMANHSYAQRLENLEILRRRSYGELPPLEKIITIITATYK